jgi:hypothetical protein
MRDEGLSKENSGTVKPSSWWRWWVPADWPGAVLDAADKQKMAGDGASSGGSLPRAASSRTPSRQVADGGAVKTSPWVRQPVRMGCHPFQERLYCQA